MAAKKPRGTPEREAVAGSGPAYGTFGDWPPTPDSSLFSTNEAAIADSELTQAEREEYQRGLVTWKKAKSWRFWIRWKWVPWYALLLAAMCVLATLSIYHREVSSHLRYVWFGGDRCQGTGGKADSRSSST